MKAGDRAKFVKDWKRRLHGVNFLKEMREDLGKVGTVYYVDVDGTVEWRADDDPSVLYWWLPMECLEVVDG